MTEIVNCYTNIMSVTNMMRILICCISLLAFVACNDKGAQNNKRRPVPGLITSPRVLGQREPQKCVPKDTLYVVNDALCK